MRRWSEKLGDTMTYLEKRFKLRGSDDDLVWLDIFAVSQAAPLLVP
jgi:hypothetical protein